MERTPASICRDAPELFASVARGRGPAANEPALPSAAVPDVLRREAAGRSGPVSGLVVRPGLGPATATAFPRLRAVA